MAAMGAGPPHHSRSTSSSAACTTSHTAPLTALNRCRRLPPRPCRAAARKAATGAGRGRGRKAAGAEGPPVEESPPPEQRPEYVPPADEEFPTFFGNFTPANFISFADQPEDEIDHDLHIDIDAAPETLWEYFYQWRNVPKVFDLIDTIAVPPDEPDSDAVLVSMFYRFGALPMMQLVSAVHRVVVEPPRRLVALAVEGMPVRVIVDLHPLSEEGGGGGTRVRLRVTHSPPTLLHEWVGPAAVEGSVADILRENLDMLKEMAEGRMSDEARAEHYRAMRPDFVPVHPEDTVDYAAVPDGKVRAVARKKPVGGDAAPPGSVDSGGMV